MIARPTNHDLDESLDELFDQLSDPAREIALAAALHDSGPEWTASIEDVESALRALEPRTQDADLRNDKDGFVAETMRLIAEVPHPRTAFRGATAAALREAAIDCLPQAARHEVENVPVCIVPTGQINASVVPLGNGHQAVLIDHDVLALLPFYCRSLWAYLTYDSDTPYCTDHAKEDFGVALICVAAYLHDGELSHLDDLKARRCPSLPALDRIATTLAFETTKTMLLHEFGHIVLGHTNGATTYHIGPRGEKPSLVEALGHLHRFELEADRFAIEALTSESGDALYASLGPIVFLSMWQLLDAIHAAYGHEPTRTHPLATTRIEQLMRLSGADHDDSTVARQIESTIDVLGRSFSSWLATRRQHDE